jgi:hypothetical protein
VHRDLKPANILLVSDGGVRGECSDNTTLHSPRTTPPLTAHQPKISDFGLVKRLHGGAGLTQTNHVMGTPAYMAPEQARGKSKEVGPAADVYALGAILYEMLTGKPPIQAGSGLEALHQVVHVEPVAPSQLRPEVPRALEAICLKCLRKVPQQRYASALALAEDLRRFRTGQQVQARPPGRWRRLGRRLPGAEALLLISAAVALLLIVIQVGLRLVVPTPAANNAATESKPKTTAPNVTNPGPILPEPDKLLIFKDDFDGLLPVVELLRPEDVDFKRVNGNGRLTGKASVVLPILYPDYQIQDFVADFEVRFPRDAPAGVAGLLFRVQRQDKALPHYNVLAFERQNGQLRLLRFDRPRRPDAYGWTTLAACGWMPELDRDIPVRLEVVGQRLRVWLNKVLLLQATDETSPEPGPIGWFVVRTDPQSTTVLLRDLRVSRPAP